MASVESKVVVFAVLILGVGFLYTNHLNKVTGLTSRDTEKTYVGDGSSDFDLSPFEEQSKAERSEQSKASREQLRFEQSQLIGMLEQLGQPRCVVPEALKYLIRC